MSVLYLKMIAFPFLSNRVLLGLLDICRKSCGYTPILLLEIF